MTRTMCISLVALVVAATTALAPVAGAHPQSVRSGSITGWGATWPAMFNGEARDCQWSEWDAGGNPEWRRGCRATAATRWRAGIRP